MFRVRYIAPPNRKGATMADQDPLDGIARLVTEGTMRAAAMMIREHRFPKLDAARHNNMDDFCRQVTDALKEEMLARLDGCIEEWRDAMEAMMPELMLRAILNTQCNHIAAMALRKLEDSINEAAPVQS
jgi:hypothetical protein